MTPRARALLLVPAALTTALLLAGCGGDDGGAGAEPYVDAMARSMASDGTTPIAEKDARCIAEGIVEVVGLDRIREAGTPEEFESAEATLDFSELDLTQEQGADIYATFGECGVDMRELMLAELDGNDEMSAETKECVRDVVTDQALEDFFVTVMTQGQEGLGQADLTDDLMECARTDAP